MVRESKNRFIAFGDIHFPYQDDNALSKLLKFISKYNPENLIMLGDVLDFYDLSSFDKDPLRVDNLQEEIDLAKKFFKKLKRVCQPNCNIFFIMGNHEERLKRYLSKHPEIASLENLKIENLLGLNEMKINFVPYKLNIHNVTFTHGDIVRKHSGYSAHGQAELHDGSGCSGHTHRLGSYYKTTPNKMDEWHEAGCLCKLDPEYIPHTPNWQQGFLYGKITKDIVEINNHKI